MIYNATFAVAFMSYIGTFAVAFFCVLSLTLFTMSLWSIASGHSRSVSYWTKVAVVSAIIFGVTLNGPFVDIEWSLLCGLLCGVIGYALSRVIAIGFSRA
jgi:hypothetical protein